MSEVHDAANAALVLWPDKAAMRKELQKHDRQIKLIAGELVKRQMLMFEHGDYRYLGWCTVRVDRSNRNG